MLGLLRKSPVVPESTYLSKRRMLALQVRANPKDCLWFCEDKFEFFTRCVKSGLATPRVFGVLCREPFDAGAVPVVSSPAAVEALFATEGPREFMLKPVAGAHGYGVTGFKFDGKQFLNSAGERVSVEDLFAHTAHWGYRKWLLQDRVFPHPELVKLSGTRSIQTARVVTCLDPNGKVQIAIAWLRIIVGKHLCDNFNFGTSGNVIATIDLETGKLKHAMGVGQSQTRLGDCTHHPVTGQPFEGFRVPLVDQIRDLTLRAGEAFKPLRTIGWDVAITDSGAMLIEGNPRWDPLPTRQDLGEVAAYLRARPGA